jgi:hypothetical protein
MTPPPAGPPTGRVLAAWWRQLAPHGPRRMWLIDWLIHRMDVLTSGTRVETLEPLRRHLLEALGLSESPSATSVAIRLGLEPALAAALLVELADAGLVQPGIQTSWMITEAGRAALAHGSFSRRIFRRRSLCLRHDTSTFLPLVGPGQPVALIDPPPAPLEQLRACAARPPEWKRRVGFPEEIDSILDLCSTTPETVPQWKLIPVDRPERLMAVLLSTDDRLLGFPIRPDGLSLGPDPYLTVPADGVAELGLSEPDADSWRRAWCEWAQATRALGTEEAGAAALEAAGPQVIVTVSARLRERLQASRPEVFRGDVWLTAGDAACRAAAELVVRA